MKRFITTLALLSGIAIAPAFAQQGHPLTGTWQGDWSVEGGTSNFLTLIMDWDGKAIVGIANPGPDSTPIGTLVLDSSDWSVDIDTELKDSQSKSVHFKGEGMLTELGSQTRTIKGTWSDNGQSGTFTLTRQSGS